VRDYYGEIFDIDLENAYGANVYGSYVDVDTAGALQTQQAVHAYRANVGNSSGRGAVNRAFGVCSTVYTGTSHRVAVYGTALDDDPWMNPLDTNRPWAGYFHGDARVTGEVEAQSAKVGSATVTGSLTIPVRNGRLNPPAPATGALYLDTSTSPPMLCVHDGNGWLVADTRWRPRDPAPTASRREWLEYGASTGARER
jgi:hypothetical protein